MAEETPHTVHGRLLEAAHISGYSFQRACDELEWLVDQDRWKQLGFTDGATFVESVHETFKNAKLTTGKEAIAQRKKLARSLSGIASQRAVAKALGVDETTVRRDLGTRAAANAAPDKRNTSNDKGAADATAANAAPAYFQDPDLDPAKLAKGRAARKERDREAEKSRISAAAKSANAEVDAKLRLGDFRQVLADLQDVDAIITDPPYGKEYLPLLSDIAQWAKIALKPDGVLAVLFGQTWLADAYRLLDEGRPYRWTMAYLTPGAGYAARHRKVQSHWKPVLVYGGGARFDDVLKSAPSGSGVEKSLHKWEQDYEGFCELIRRLTEPGALIADPFAGSGTTLLAARALGRNAIGAEIDPEAHAKAQERLGANGAAT